MPIHEEKVCTKEQIQRVLANISFVPSCVDFEWKWQVEQVFRVDHKANPHNLDIHPFVFAGWLVNTTFRRPDTNTGQIATGAGRKEFIPYGITVSGVVKTCFLLCRLIVEHEIMESYCYNGNRPFDPHNSINDLNDIQKKQNRPHAGAVRDGAISVEFL